MPAFSASYKGSRPRCGQGLRKTSTILDLFVDVPRMGYSEIQEQRIMARTETIRARVEAKLKADAEAVLDELGLTASDAIRLLYQHC